MALGRRAKALGRGAVLGKRTLNIVIPAQAGMTSRRPKMALGRGAVLGKRTLNIVIPAQAGIHPRRPT
jgi:predicted component of type VI protein secretion system